MPCQWGRSRGILGFVLQRTHRLSSEITGSSASAREHHLADKTLDQQQWIGSLIRLMLPQTSFRSQGKFWVSVCRETSLMSLCIVRRLALLNPCRSSISVNRRSHHGLQRGRLIAVRKDSLAIVCAREGLHISEKVMARLRSLKPGYQPSLPRIRPRQNAPRISGWPQL